MELSRSASAIDAYEAVVRLQRRMVEAQEAVARGAGSDETFVETGWLRDGGAHGGGARFGVASTPTFDRASVNVSQVHYPDEPARRLASATALSTIIHPRHPRAPSVHVHVSWTELRGEPGYWRVMADLNPSLVEHPFTRAAAARFGEALRQASGPLYDEAARQGDQYFFIPALGRHRGVSHFYLEQHRTEDLEGDRALAEAVGRAAIDTHAALCREALAEAGPPTDEERAAQLGYHTLYLFQVLTLDRGTTSGLLVHDQNDVGILGSLPSHADRTLLAGWRPRLPETVRPLLDALLEALPRGSGPVAVEDPEKRALAAACRDFYRKNPAALELQARGFVIPPTVQNHR